MRCLLFRHGIAVSPEDWKGKESERPLTQEGHDKTRRAAEGLRRLNLQPTHILCSPFTRTRETAGIVREMLSRQADIRLCPELVFDQSPLLVFPILQEYPQDATVFCVGHEPHLGQTAALMLFGQGCPGLSLKKAGGCLIGFEGNVKPARGFLEWWLPPAQLRLLGKGK
jgi:phosphohistidine phosphatase